MSAKIQGITLPLPNLNISCFMKYFNDRGRHLAQCDICFVITTELAIDNCVYAIYINVSYK